MPFTAYSTTAADTRILRIAANVSGLDLKVEEVKTVHDKSPANQGPVLDTGAGMIFGAAAVLRWIARSSAGDLNGAGSTGTGIVDQWTDLIHRDLATNASNWVTPVLKKKVTEPAITKAAKKGTVTALRALNTSLTSSQWIGGNTISIADIYAFGVCIDLFTTVLAPPTCRPIPSVVRWFNTLLNGEPAFSSVAGTIEFCKKEQFAPKPAKKKEVKQAAAKPKVEKKKNPLLLLPESRMNMDATKKSFFSTPGAPFNAQFFDNFWTDVYDPKGYCIYTLQYKYNDENTVYWQTQNLLGGFNQRMDPARKFAFGCLLLTGASEEKGPWDFCGTFIFRGTGLPQEVLDNSQYDQFNWTPLDVSTPENQALFKEYMQGDTVRGANALDRRYFK